MDPAPLPDAPATELPRRIVLASGEPGLYGGERQLLLLADGLRHRGVDVSLLARRGGRVASVGAERGWPTDTFSHRPTPLGLWRCRRRLRDLRPDVLHCNDSRALTTVGLAAIGLPIPLRSAARRVCFPIRSPLAFRLLSDRVICVSEAVRRRCVEGGLERDRLHLARDAVDVARIEGGDANRARADLELAEEAVAVLVPASLVPCKGHRFVLEALPEVWARCPDVTLLLAGDGPLRHELEGIARSMDRGRVRLLGYRDDIADLLAAAGLVVLPSLEEGFGSAIAEAAWAGTPVVASDVGGVPELLRDEGMGAAGWLVPPARPGPLAEAILEALANGDEAARRASLARARVRERHHPDATLEATLRAWSPGATGGR